MNIQKRWAVNCASYLGLCFTLPHPCPLEAFPSSFFSVQGFVLEGGFTSLAPEFTGPRLLQHRAPAPASLRSLQMEACVSASSY